MEEERRPTVEEDCIAQDAVRSKKRGQYDAEKADRIESERRKAAAEAERAEAYRRQKLEVGAFCEKVKRR